MKEEAEEKNFLNSILRISISKTNFLLYYILPLALPRYVRKRTENHTITSHHIYLIHYYVKFRCIFLTRLKTHFFANKFHCSRWIVENICPDYLTFVLLCDKIFVIFFSCSFGYYYLSVRESFFFFSFILDETKSSL